MANKNLFNTKNIRRGPKADTVNEAGGVAYSMTDKHALAQLVATGCLGGTFYASAEAQLDTILDLAKKVGPEFVAKCAVYGRSKAYMKDTPALLVAYLAATKNNDLVNRVFDRVIDNGKMLRNFVQMIRSGKMGRRSFGTSTKRTIQRWLNEKSDAYLFRASVGNDPALADIIKMVHPKPPNKTRSAFYSYLLDKEYATADLPEIVRAYEDFKAGVSTEAPDVDFRMLTSLPLKEKDWKKIATDARWQMTRMNLNTFARNGVLKDKAMAKMIAERLANPEQVRESRCFPYQLFTAYMNCEADVPTDVRDALQDAMEIAVENVPTFPGKVWVFPDVSGSMSSPATGYRGGGTTKVSCQDVAALVAATVLRKNPTAGVLPFAHKLYDDVYVNGRDSIVTNAERLARCGGGGTACSLPLARLNQKRENADLVIYVSDNQSWADSGSWAGHSWGGGSTSTQHEWEKLKSRCPKAKMVCIDIQPNTTTQARDAGDVLNIGGFSDVVFDVIANFAEAGSDPKHWVKTIEDAVEL